MFWEVIEQVSDAPPRCFMGSLGGFAHEMFELGKDLLNGVQVRAVWWQKQEPGTNTPDGAANGGSFVTGEIIHDHHIARRERWDEALLDIVLEAVAVDRLIHDARCIDPVTT